MDGNKTPTIPGAIDPEEFNAVEKEADLAKTAAEESVFSYTHNFVKPFSYEGKTYETLAFDFGKLTGRDGLAIQDELDAKGKAVLVKQMNDHYLLRVAARACTTPISTDVIAAMPLYEFNKILQRARTFLIRSGL